MKKIKGRNYLIRGFALLAAVFLLFLFIRPGEEKYPSAPPWSALQERRDESESHSFKFAFLSDLHKGWGVFEPIIKELEKNGYAFAVIGGDFVPRNREDRYRFFFRKLSEVRGKLPLYFTAGNHDLDEKNIYSVGNFRAYCGPDYYWFSWGSAAFVVLNDSQLTISEEQFSWLENTLRKLKGSYTHLFVFMHVPAFDPRAGKQYSRLPKDVSQKFMRIMEKFGVDYVFSGHLHCYFRKVVNGVTYVGNPSAGGGSRCANPSFGYIRIEVEGKEVKDSVVRAENNWLLQFIGDIQYELRVRSPFLFPFVTLALGQSFLYFLAV